MLRFIRKNYLILFIGLLAFFVRWIQLDTVPNGFHVDELNAGYIGNYIVQHGFDILGHHLPLTYNKFGDYRPTGIFYLSGISTWLFGSTIAAVRLSSVLFGALTVIAIYFLTMELFQKKRVALGAACILAVLPWHIVLSRATSEAVIGLFFLTLGLAFVTRYINTKKQIFFILGGIVLFFSYLFYHSFRLITPLLVFSLLTLVKNSKQKYKLIFLGFIASCITACIFLLPNGIGRGNQVAFYNNPDTPKKIQSLINADGPNAIFSARMFHNKPIIYLYELVKNFKEYYSPNFLGFIGGLPYRYVVPEFGLMPILFYLLFILAVVSFIPQLFKTNARSIRFLFLLLLITPLPGIITYEDTPNVHRTICMIIPICILISWQIDLFIHTKLPDNVKKSIYFFAGLCCMWEFMFFAHQYFVHAKSYNSYARNDGYVELIDTIKQLRKTYTAIYVPGFENIPLYYLFFTSDYQHIQFLNNPNEVLLTQRENVFFVPDWCASNYVIKEKILTDAVLIIDREGCQTDERFTLIQSIFRKDATKAFDLKLYHPTSIGIEVQ